MFILFVIGALVLFIIAGLGFSGPYFHPQPWGLAVLTAGYMLMVLGVIGSVR